jgi:2-keto-3-deoxy-galactonokinase
MQLPIHTILVFLRAQLAELYQKAADRLGYQIEIIDARQAFLKAVQHIHSHWSA